MQVESGICAEEAEEMNIGFLKRMRTGLPFVRSKITMSLDGDIYAGLSNGQSKWITGKLAGRRADDGELVQAPSWRVQALLRLIILQLNVRLPDVQRAALESHS